MGIYVKVAAVRKTRPSHRFVREDEAQQMAMVCNHGRPHHSPWMDPPQARGAGGWTRVLVVVLQGPGMAQVRGVVCPASMSMSTSGMAPCTGRASPTPIQGVEKVGSPNP